MRPRSAFAFLLISGFLLLTSCSSVERVRTDDFRGPDLTRINPDQVKIYPMDPGRPYEVMGLVLAAKDAGEDSSSVESLAREQASALGADAIIDAKLNFAMGMWNNGLAVSGVAVKLK